MSFAPALLMVLFVAFLHGLAYLLIVPPWQHYDEPAHVEYVAAVAAYGLAGRDREADPALRREILGSMVASGFFAEKQLPAPNLAAATLPPVGLDQRSHPPGYYLIAALPWNLFADAPIETRLTAVRSLSLLFFMITVAAAWATARLVAPTHGWLSLSAPLGLALLPPLADLMTAVNNDTAAILLGALAAWLSARLLRCGWSWPTGVGLLLVALAVPFVKSTALVAVVLAAGSVVLALWLALGWRLRWFVAVGLLSALLSVLLLLDRGGAAGWYAAYRAAPSLATDVSVAPQGARAAMLLVAPQGAAQLTAPLLPSDAPQLAGQPITVGGWFWASAPITTVPLRLQVFRAGSGAEFVNLDLNQRVEITAEPRYYAWHLNIPAETLAINYEFRVNNRGDQPLTAYLDGAVLVAGHVATEQPPRNQPNLLRNGDFEQPGWQIRPAANQIIDRFVRLPVTPYIAAMSDLDRIGGYLVRNALPELIFAAVGVFSWSQVRLPLQPWLPIVGAALGLSLLGGLWQMPALRRRSARTQALGLLFGGAALLLWLIAWLRVLPVLPPIFAIPIARYAFPALVPTAILLVCGMLGPLPSIWRRWASGTLIAVGVICSLISLFTVLDYFEVNAL